MMTGRAPQPGEERTRILAWFTNGLQPALRRPAARLAAPGPAAVTSPIVADEPTQETDDGPTHEITLRPAAVVETIPARPARPGPGRHRAPFTPLLTRARRTLRPDPGDTGRGEVGHE